MFRRWIACLLILSLAMPLPAHAGMVATENLLDRERIVTLLERADIHAQLQAYGVNPGEIKARVGGADGRRSRRARREDRRASRRGRKHPGRDPDRVPGASAHRHPWLYQGISVHPSDEEVNRLAEQTSPYLQQHAANPVEWYPWGPEALERARAEDKPILLSIGYSACHWCHVMAHESFEDPAVAAVMNRLFVNVKVDREERPDLDQIYQSAHQMLAQRARRLAAHHVPRPRWHAVLRRHVLSEAGALRPAGISRPVRARRASCGATSAPRSARRAPRCCRPSAARCRSAAGQPGDLGRSAGRSAAGYPAGELRRAPSADSARRPSSRIPPISSFACASGETGMAHATLKRMCEGGIYDQLGGGFCRYSVDAQWRIPHFEKMLYDNGPLLGLLADAWLVDRRCAVYAQCAEETAGWMMREMQSPEGGYYSSLDADSEHEEGKFYVWDRDEVQRLLTAEEYAVAAPHFGLDQPPNFENRHWHLHVAKPDRPIAVHRVARKQNSSPLAKSACGPGATKKSWCPGTRLRSAAWRTPGAYSATRHGSPRRAVRWNSSAPRCGATGGSPRPTRTAARISTRTSTTMRC